MARNSGNRSYAFVLSMLGHAALVVALTFSLPLQAPERPGTGEEVVPIDTVMIGEAALEAELDRIDAERIAEEQAELEAARAEQRRIEEQQAAAERLRQQEAAAAAAEAERQRQLELEAQRQAELEAQREAELEAQRQAELEAQRQAELEAQRQAELEAQRQAELEAQRQAELEAQRRAAEEAARRAAIAAEVAQAAEREEAARQARESGLQDQWLAQISNRIERYWRRPPTAQAGIVCVLDVDWVRTGDVIGVRVVESECNGDAATRRSIESAVLEASPLPQPPVPSLFDRNLRIRFAPD